MAGEPRAVVAAIGTPGTGGACGAGRAGGGAFTGITEAALPHPGVEVDVCGSCGAGSVGCCGAGSICGGTRGGNSKTCPWHAALGSRLLSWQ